MESRRRAHFDAGDRGLFVVDYDGINVSSENRSNGKTVLVLCRFAEIDNPSFNSCGAIPKISFPPFIAAKGNEKKTNQETFV